MNTQATPRERLLDAAGELFYRDGVNIGVDALCKAAGVSKKSMYQLFRSKDELIAESLANVGPGYQQALEPGVEDGDTPRERILAVFRNLDRAAAGQEFQGCPFVSTAFELKNPEHPGSVVARHFKQRLTDFFLGELVAARGRRSRGDGGPADDGLRRRERPGRRTGPGARRGRDQDGRGPPGRRRRPRPSWPAAPADPAGTAGAVGGPSSAGEAC